MSPKSTRSSVKREPSALVRMNFCASSLDRTEPTDSELRSAYWQAMDARTVLRRRKIRSKTSSTVCWVGQATVNTLSKHSVQSTILLRSSTTLDRRTPDAANSVSACRPRSPAETLCLPIWRAQRCAFALTLLTCDMSDDNSVTRSSEILVACFTRFAISLWASARNSEISARTGSSAKLDKNASKYAALRRRVTSFPIER